MAIFDLVLGLCAYGGGGVWCVVWSGHSVHGLTALGYFNCGKESGALYVSFMSAHNQLVSSHTSAPSFPPMLIVMRVRGVGCAQFAAEGDERYSPGSYSSPVPSAH